MKVDKATRARLRRQVAKDLRDYFLMVEQGCDFGRKPCKENFYLQAWERQEDGCNELPREAAQSRAIKVSAPC